MNKKGFTLIELLIVIAIIGIIAAIAIPNLLMAINKGRQKRSIGDLHTISTGILSFFLDNSTLPTTGIAVGAGALTRTGPAERFETATTPELVPFHMGDTSNLDGWGNGYMYGATGAAANGDVVFYMATSGSDIILTVNIADIPTAVNYQMDDLTDFQYDVVFAQGQLAYGPASAAST